MTDIEPGVSPTDLTTNNPWKAPPKILSLLPSKFNFQYEGTVGPLVPIYDDGLLVAKQENPKVILVRRKIILPSGNHKTANKVPKGIDLEEMAIPDSPRHVEGKTHEFDLFAEYYHTDDPKKLAYIQRLLRENPREGQYLEFIQKNGAMPPLEANDLPDTFYHTARCIIDSTNTGPIDQITKLQSTGVIGSDLPNSRFYITRFRSWSLKEVTFGDNATRKRSTELSLNFDRAKQLMMVTIDPKQLALYRDVYPDPESLTVYNGEWGIHFMITGGLPGTAIKQIDIFDEYDL